VNSKLVSDCWQTDGSEEEAEGDVCWGARPRHGRLD